MLKLVVLAAVLGLALAKAVHPFNGKIIGGQKATQGQFPSIVSLQDANFGGHFCGGAIISDRFIISAGHCFYNSDDPADTVAVAGSTDNTKGTIIKFSRIVVHPDFDPFGITSDITLLQTASPIKFTDNIQPVALPTDANADLAAGTDITALGWGTISYPNQNYPKDLYYVGLQVVTNAKCAKDLDTDIAKSQICVGGGDGKGLCFGDSGSPLIRDNTTYGIVSWGEPCGIGYPDVFTRVSSFTSWISENQRSLLSQESN